MKELHPAVIFCYFAAVLGISMCTMYPLFAGMSLFAGGAYSFYLNGRKALKQAAWIAIPTATFVFLIRPLFSHRGETVLFYINDNAVTLETILYGLVSAIVFLAVVFWCQCLQKLLTGDKVYYLFGKFSPVLGMLFSMTLRFIPLLRKRYGEIRAGQMGMGRGKKNLKTGQKAALAVRELSVLTAWTLEESIEISEAMESRGYGLHGRTSYHTYRFQVRDSLVIAFILTTAVTMAGILAAGKGEIYFYPAVVMKKADTITIGGAVIYMALLWFPMILDRTGDYKWKRLLSKI